jgi:hypothetical protein
MSTPGSVGAMHNVSVRMRSPFVAHCIPVDVEDRQNSSRDLSLLGSRFVRYAPHPGCGLPRLESPRPWDIPHVEARRTSFDRATRDTVLGRVSRSRSHRAPRRTRFQHPVDIKHIQVHGSYGHSRIERSSSSCHRSLSRPHFFEFFFRARWFHISRLARIV